MYFFYSFIFKKGKYQSSQLQSVFGRDMLNKYIFSNTIYNRLNNRDFNIDQNNLDYDFFHNRAALALCVQERFTSIPSRLWQPSSEWPNTELPNYNFL